MERTKDSAMKAIAKRPKLFAPLMKGGHTIHELKTIGECSGGLIRTLIWAGVAEVLEDKTIKFTKGIKQSDMPSLDKEVKTKKESPKGKVAAKKETLKTKEKAKTSPAPKPSKVTTKAPKKVVSKAVEDSEEDEDEEPKKAEKPSKKDLGK